MNSAPSTNFEQSSDFRTWIALVCSGLALMIFFGWIVNDLSTVDSPDQRATLFVQPMSEFPATAKPLDNASNVNSLAASQPSGTAPADSNPASKYDEINSARKSTPTPDAMNQDTALLTQQDVSDRTSAENSGSGKANTSQWRQSTELKVAKSSSPDKLSTSERKNLRVNANEYDSNAHVGLSQSETTNDQPEELAGVPFNSIVDAQSSSAAAEKRPVSVTGKSESPATEHAQPPSAYLGALRLLLAEAAAINEAGDEPLQAEQPLAAAQDSLGILSKDLRFDPGSKVANDSMYETLNQIEAILSEYPETSVDVVVATNENGDDVKDLLLSQERGRTLIARFVNEGLDFSRFSLKALTDVDLPVNSHKIEIKAHAKS